jgi:hypothetical protein
MHPHLYVIIYSLALTIAVYFPYLKIPIFFYTLSRFPMSESFLHTNRYVRMLLDNYFWVQFAVIFGVSYFTKAQPTFEWITIPRVLYSLVVYESYVLIIAPYYGILISVAIHYADSYPLLYSVVNSVASSYASPIVLLPEKVVLLLACKIFDMFKS